MRDNLNGIHHVTAVTAAAQSNLHFYTEKLGMRLVKRTVNQDDVSAYHLFYGDEVGSAGTELTFFDWSHAAPRRHGAGSITETGLRVRDVASLQWWSKQCEKEGIRYQGIVDRNGRPGISLIDCEEQCLALVADEGKARMPMGTPWPKSGIPPEFAVCGLNHVCITVRDLHPTEEVLTGALNFRRAASYSFTGIGTDASHEVVVFETGEGGPGTEVHIAVRPELRRGTIGRGGVHHVAFRVANDDEHRWWHKHLVSMGINVTEVIDRYYFRSLYFREPGGALFEIATDGPGFAVDEEKEHLGERLSLPPFLEGRRSEIEAGLKPLSGRPD